MALFKEYLDISIWKKSSRCEIRCRYLRFQKCSLNWNKRRILVFNYVSHVLFSIMGIKVLLSRMVFKSRILRCRALIYSTEIHRLGFLMKKKLAADRLLYRILSIQSFFARNGKLSVSNITDYNCFFATKCRLVNFFYFSLFEYSKKNFGVQGTFQIITSFIEYFRKMWPW